MPREHNIAIRLSLKDGELVKRALQGLGRDGQQALRRIERQGEPTSRSLLAVNAASQELKGSLVAATGRLGIFGTALRNLGPVGLAVGASMAAATIGISKLVSRTREAVTRLEGLADAANQAGVGAARLQELRFALTQNGGTALQMDDALRRLTRRLGLFAQDGGGPAAKAFEAMGIAATDSAGRVRSTGDVFDEVVEKLGGIQSQAELSAMASQFFGEDAGPKLVPLLSQGAAGMAAWAAKARDLGIVLEDRIVAKAAETSAQLRAVEEATQMLVDGALVDLGPLLIDMAEMFNTAARGAGRFRDMLAALDEMSTQGLQRRHSALLAEIADKTGELAAVQRELAEMRQHPEAFGAEITAREGVAAGLRAEIETLRAEEDKIISVFRSRSDAQPLVTTTSSGGIGASNPTDSKAFDDYLAKLREENRLLSAQTSSRELLRTLLEAEKAAKEQGVKFDSDRKRAVIELVLANQGLEQSERSRLDAEREAARIRESLLTPTEKLVQAQERLAELVAGGFLTDDEATRALQGLRDELETTGDIGREAGQVIGGAFKDLLFDLSNTDQALQQVGQRLASMALDRTVGSAFDTVFDNLFSGKGGGLFGFADGGVMSPAGPIPLRRYAGGGIADRPQLALFGEGDHNEAFVPLPDGRSIPVTVSGGGGGSFVYSPTFNLPIQASGGRVDPASIRQAEYRLRKSVEQAQADFLVRQRRPGGALG